MAGGVLADPVRILAVGGSTRPDSSTERALRGAIQAALGAGAQVRSIVGRDLMVPIYDTETTQRAESAQELVDAFRWAEGLIVASPGYHGGISGLVKNALDYVEDLREHDRVYLDGMAVGCISVAYGWQAAVSTLHQLRQVTHALRGWPTPLGVSVNATAVTLDPQGRCDDESVSTQLRTVGEQVVEFSRMRRYFHEVD